MVSQSDLLPMMIPTSGRGSAMGLFHHVQTRDTKEGSRIGAMKCAAATLRIALRTIGLLTLAATAAAQTPAALQLDYTEFKLANGLTVILHEDHSVPIVSVNVWYHVGSARERTGRTGFAHLFEHLMFMGSGHVKPGEFDEWLESAGGQNNGSTTEDRTNYWITVPSNALSSRSSSSPIAWATCSTR